MMFRSTSLAGVVIIERTEYSDERGFFTRLHDPAEFAEHGHPFMPVQTSLSHNTRAGTLRGLHWQAPPMAETKLVRVVRGRIFDVCVDIRPNSPTFRSWFGIELDADAGRALLIGPGLAHGFMTRADNTDVLYQIGPEYAPGYVTGARWNDPAFGIYWGQEPVIISPRDQAFPPFQIGPAA
jgi:dTDP-4-dehydrorhamnose 3,5-epimerase